MSLTCGPLFFCAFAFVGFLVLAFVFIYDVASNVEEILSKSLFFSRQQQKDHKKKEKKGKEKKNVTKMWQK